MNLSTPAMPALSVLEWMILRRVMMYGGISAVKMSMKTNLEVNVGMRMARKGWLTMEGVSGYGAFWLVTPAGIEIHRQVLEATFPHYQCDVQLFHLPRLT